jgi:N-acetylglucosaminyldiphosphoundecaprenol N-acetyl-beta-D-mannosaminyltransferase
MKSTAGESTAGQAESKQRDEFDFEIASSTRSQSDVLLTEQLAHESFSPRKSQNSATNGLIIAGIPIASFTEDETVTRIDELISLGGPHYGAVVNAAKLVAAERDPELKRALVDADLVTADGMSVVWAARLLGKPLRQRVTGIDLFERLLAHAEEQGLSVYFLGAHEDSVRGTVEFSKRRHPSLRIAGYHNGYFEESENGSICNEIMRSCADLLFVAMGSPKQELWIASNILTTGVRFALGVGGSFDHLSGKVRRAPGWMQKSGLEWLHRFLQEPTRLWRRYLIGNSEFIILIVRQLIGGSRSR